MAGAGVTCLVIIAVLLGVRVWDLDGQVSNLSEENGALATENGALDGQVSDLTTERDSIRAIFPLSRRSFADADLRGTYEFLFEPVEGACTYSDCDQIGPAAYRLSIDRSSSGYVLTLDGVEATPAPMSRDGDVYSASGVLPESLWGGCGETPVETSFELHLTVRAVGLANGELRAVEGSGRYREYTPDVGLGCGLSEMSFTFDARRAG
jgi:hypothetical protein